MRLKRFFILFLLFVAPISNGEEYLGKIVFYIEGAKELSPEEEQERTEVESDLFYVIEGAEGYLETHKIKYEVQRGLPISISTLNGNRILLSKRELPAAVGYILIKNNGEYVVRGGLGTDIDVIMDVAGYFAIHEEPVSVWHNHRIQPTHSSLSLLIRS